jgi:DNA-binding Xre family transcriptional regulator
MEAAGAMRGPKGGHPMRKAKGNRSIGSDFDDFLREEGIYEAVNALAAKEILALEMGRALKAKKLTKTELAARMKTSRAAVDRLLNPENPSINLKTMERAASALGKRITIQLAEA